MHSPTSFHWTAAKRVLRYLKATIDHGFYFSKGSNWTGSLDDQRSIIGFDIFLVTTLLSWCAKKQLVVSHSSTEAKYRAMAVTTAKLH